MANYKSSEITIPAAADIVYNKLSNLENLKSVLSNVPADKIPADQREMFDKVEITSDSISVPGGPIGALTFRVTEKKEPSLIRLEAEGSPLPLGIVMHISENDANSSKGYVEIDIDIPLMLKPMIGGQVQKMADQFAQMLQLIPFA